MADAMNYKSGDLPIFSVRKRKLNATSNWLYSKLFFRDSFVYGVESYRLDSSFFIGADMENSHKYFENRECQYYPCHKEMEQMNCMFCYCPLYHLPKCPGEYQMIEVRGRKIKECTKCTFPHKAENYEVVLALLSGKCM